MLQPKSYNSYQAVSLLYLELQLYRFLNFLIITLKINSLTIYKKHESSIFTGWYSLEHL